MRNLILAFAGTALLLGPACKSTKKSDVGPPIERFVIKDKEKRLRVDGRVQDNRMVGTWHFFDPKGERLASLSYRGGRREGLVEMYFVSSDGPAVGRQRMSGTFRNGALEGFARSKWPAGGPKLEREFDQGVLEGAKGWQEDGSRMSDGEAMKLAVQESRFEESMLAELENFVQLQMRRRAAQKAQQAADAKAAGMSEVPGGSRPPQPTRPRPDQVTFPDAPLVPEPGAPGDPL